METHISFCVPTYNRYDLTVRCINSILNDDRINDIVCVDDASTDDSFNRLKEYFSGIDKVRLYQNESNMDCYFNKFIAVSKAINKYCVVADSDNVFGLDYIDAVYKHGWDERVSIMPSFAYPTFNYKEYVGTTIDRTNVAEMMGRPMFDTMLNCMNFFINRDEYLNIWDSHINPHTADSIYFNYKWFERGNKMFVAPDMKYGHTIHEGSHYVNNNHLTPAGLYDSIVQKLKELK